MLVVTGTIQIVPEDVDILRKAATVMSAATRQEAGCVIYEFSEDIETPGRFRVYEEWHDINALKAHCETEHMASFRAALSQATTLGRDIRLDSQ